MEELLAELREMKPLIGFPKALGGARGKKVKTLLKLCRKAIRSREEQLESAKQELREFEDLYLRG